MTLAERSVMCSFSKDREPWVMHHGAINAAGARHEQ